MEAISALLHAGVAKDVLDWQGHTAAMCARLNDHADVADLLNQPEKAHLSSH